MDYKRAKDHADALHNTVVSLNDNYYGADGIKLKAMLSIAQELHLIRRLLEEDSTLTAPEIDLSKVKLPEADERLIG